jgi:hypothetical protein
MTYLFPSHSPQNLSNKISLFWVVCFVPLLLLQGCSEPTYTFRCSCNKIAYNSAGNVLKDDSFHQVVCDTTTNIEQTFENDLSDLAQDCSQYFDGVENIAETDCSCTCDLIGDCN